jgi:serine/threonine protein kinase, bacterial
VDSDAADAGAAPARPAPRRRTVLILTALGVVAVAVIAIVMINRMTNRPSPSCAARSTTIIAPPTQPSSSGMQTVLSFCGHETPEVVAVDSAGNVYVVTNGSRMLKLAPGSTEPTVVVPFAGFVGRVYGVAVDSAGTLYAADQAYGCVWKLAVGATALEKLPFNGVRNPEGVAVDRAGAVYVSDTGNRQVLKLAGGSEKPGSFAIHRATWPARRGRRWHGRRLRPGRQPGAETPSGGEQSNRLALPWSG